MQPNDNEKALTIATGEPDVVELNAAYDQTVADLGWYIEGCQDSYNWRRNIWPGKARDLRKHGGDAFPWDGAADTEAHVVGSRINTYVAMFMAALNKANIRAYPVESGDMERAKVVSSFVKWMISSYIPGFTRQMELSANNLLERGIAITYVGWEKVDRTYKQQLSLDQLMQISPDLVKAIVEKTDDEQVVELLKRQFRGMTNGKAKKVLRDLRKDSVAEFPIVRRSIDAPCVEALASDGEFFFPAYTMDPQRAPYCFWRTLMSAQEIRNKVATDGWDSDWAEYVIANCKGESDLLVNQNNRITLVETSSAENNEVYEVIYAFQRLTDMEDNSEGIYCTIFNSDATGNDVGAKYAKHELMNGYDDYPVVVTKISEDDKKLYEVITMPEMLRSPQMQVKVERDSRIDRNSLATLPAILHPLGQPPPDMGPAVKIPYRRMGEIAFGPTPAYNPGSVEMEVTQMTEADNIVGLNPESPYSATRQQHLVTKFLEHVRDVMKLAWKCYQRFGPDQVFFRVTGVPDPQRFSKGDPDENFDLVINFDVLNNDPDTVEKRLNAFASLVQFDKNGRINMDAFLDAAAGSIDPILADTFLQPAEQAQQQIVKQVTDDLSKIYAGIEVGARPNGAQVALQVIQQYVQQPDVMQRVQADESFRKRLEKYQQQYVFQMQQAQNAQIGRIGTAPAQMGGMSTQGVSQ